MALSSTAHTLRHGDGYVGIAHHARQILAHATAKLRATRADLFSWSTLRLGVGLAGVAALGIEFAVIAETGTSLLQVICQFLCYFTFWMNTIAALSILVPLLAPTSAMAPFFSRRDVRAAIAANLIVVGLVYHVLLSTAFVPSWGAVADVVLHYVTPVFYVADWLLFVRRDGRLKWRFVGLPLLLPVAYGIWTLSYGAATLWSPYPFLEAHSLEPGELALNVIGLLVLFGAVTAALILADRTFAANWHTAVNRTATLPRGIASGA